MPLRVRYQFPTGYNLGFSVERLSDNALLDFADMVFRTTPATMISPLPEDTGSFVGRYKGLISATPTSQFSDGDYVVTIHNLGASNLVVGQLHSVMRNGDDATSTGSGSGSGSGPDPWAASLPGSYAAGTAGAILGTYLDAKVSSRSTYAGGPVASVTAPVVVGTITDKSGYSLAPSGLDSIQVETGVNVRQALSPILAASAGVLLGAGTGTIVIKGGNVALTRITASTDNAGNRMAVTLSLPA